jgi:hypothetical protein
MSIFSSLFGGKKKSPTGQPPEWIKILEKIAGVMEDENLQNSMYHPEITDKVFGGIDVDEFPHGIGEFGRSGENPIPVNGPIGELIYLSCLKTQRTNQRLLFHRLGSEGEIDIYETVSIDGQNWDILFFSMYHPRKSRKAPGGFVIVDPRTQPHLYGSNRQLDDFPFGLHEAIGATTEDIFGIPMSPPQVRQAEETVKFERPRDHQDRIRSTIKNISGFFRS